MKGCLKIQGDRRADLKLDALAEKLGFTTKNVLLRVLANEVSACDPRYFFKAVSQFHQYTRRRKK